MFLWRNQKTYPRIITKYSSSRSYVKADFQHDEDKFILLPKIVSTFLPYLS